MQKFENHILVPIDFSEQSLIALNQSFNIARFKNSIITLIHVIDSAFMDKFKSIFKDDSQDEKMIADAEKQLKELANKYSAETGLQFETIVEQGKIYDVIIEKAQSMNTAFIVMGTNGEVTLTKKIIGSNAVRVISNAPCPVITIKGKLHREGCKKIVMPIDITKESRDKVETGVEFAKYFNSEILILCLDDSNDEFIENKLKRQLGQVENYVTESGVQCSSHYMKVSDQSDTVLNFSKAANADLILIMAQQEGSMLEWFLSTEAQQIINESEIPVCSVKPFPRKDTTAFILEDI
ncbi:MAG: universal stress protein [Bacteroidetes bacterium]|nr:universal stress protein [Bacteroidota bacterium]